MGAVAVRHDPTSAAIVRHSIAKDLEGRGISRDSIDDVVLVASELVGNAVIHATAPGPAMSAPLDIGWEIAPEFVLLHVGDGSSVMPMPRPGTLDQTCGRGLAIVAAIAQDWGVDRTSFGKQVWAKIAISTS